MIGTVALSEPCVVSDRKGAAAAFGASSSEQIDAALYRSVLAVILNCDRQKPGDESQENDQGRPLLNGWGFPNRSNHNPIVHGIWLRAKWESMKGDEALSRLSPSIAQSISN